MKYIIYGTNRVAKDFLYIFDGLEILYFVGQKAEYQNFMDYTVHDLAYALNDKEYDRIIICDFDKKEKEESLLSRGLKYGENYVYEEDFFETLDELHIPANRKIAVWGTGQTAKKISGFNSQWNPACYIDTYKSKEQFNGIPVMTPDSITDWESYFVIIAVVKDGEIRDFLSSRNLKEQEDFVSYQVMTGMPSSLLRKTIFDKSYYDLECHTMHNHLEILHDGNTRCCCTTFVEQNLDNMLEKDAWELWHSNLHKILCLSTENRTYSFCDKSMCPLFVAKTVQEERTLAQKYGKMSDRPEVLAVGYDSTCNLSCETCRRKVYIAQGEELEKLSLITQKIQSEYLPNCKFMILAGDGEVFASRTYQDIYEDGHCNPAFIRILSNGTLFTKDRWDNFITGKTGKIMLTVSIDAATKDTYEKIRHNGNFEQLQKNMCFAAQLRKEGKLSYFRLNFVVQQKNYKEMPAFVEWGEALGVDEIFFTKILNWGTYTEEEFAEVSMMEPDGITPKKQLRDVLETPVIKNSEIVDMGTIQYFHKADKIAAVENYYMWELEKRGGRLFS